MHNNNGNNTYYNGPMIKSKFSFQNIYKQNALITSTIKPHISHYMSYKKNSIFFNYGFSWFMIKTILNTSY